MNSMKNRGLIVWTIVLLSQWIHAQDIQYARVMMDSLISPGFHGRGYVNNGEKKAAEFIASQFEDHQLQFFGDDYFQKFTMPINTFPGKMEVMVGNRTLKPGVDYTYYANSPAISGTYPLIWFLNDSMGNPQLQGDYGMIDLSQVVIVTDVDPKEFSTNEIKSRGVIYLKDQKVGWHVSRAYEVKDFFQMQVLKDKISMDDEWIHLEVESVFHEAYPTQNVIGWVQGKKDTDHYIVFTAHYDHLGRMGNETFFPGANDNASGTAMVMDLGRHFSKAENQPDVNIVFMAFSAEEAGLLGSSYYVDHPFFPLTDILFVINLDMVASGSKGIKVVNGTVFPDEFNSLVEINTTNEYLLKVSERGEAANSDHYPFYAKNVPAFFIYTLGEECKEYHSIFDDRSNVPLTEYEDLFRLLTDFIKTF